MEEGYVERGSALSDTEIAALDRVLPRLVDAFEPSARQRIVAGLTYQGRDPTPGYGFLARRLRSCSRPPNAPAEAGMRRTLKERVVTFADVERLMATVGRSAGASDVEDALDRLQVRLAPETGDGQADAEILELCLNTLSQSPDPVPGEASGLGFGDFGDPFDAPPADPLDAEEPDLAHDGYGRPTRPSQRVGDLWERALRAEIDAAGPTPLSEMTGTMQVAIVTGYRGDPKALATALGATMAGSTQPSVLSTVLVDEEGLLKSKAHNTPAKLDALVRSLLDDGNLVVFSAAAPTPPPFVAASAVRRVDLSSCAGVLARVLDGLADAKAGLRLRDGRSLSALVGACDRAAAMHHGNTDAPGILAGDEGTCSVDRIDDEQRFAFEPRGVVVGLLR